MRDFELRSAIAVTKRLPIIPGSKAIAAVIAKWCLRKPKTEVAASVFGYSTRLNPHEAVERELLFWPQLFDWREMALLRRELRPGDIFLDLGSNIGGYSLALSHAVGPAGFILSVDADPYSATRLRLTASENRIRQLHVANVGLSDLAGELTFSPQMMGNRGGGSFLAEPNVQSHKVACVTLAQLLDTHKVSRPIRAAKLDLEGYEYRVLKVFFEQQPPNRWPEILLVERSAGLLSKAGGDSSELIAAHGYRCILTHGENHIWKR